MRIPFRRRNPQLEDPNGRVFMSADEMFAALDAETAKPKPQPAVHYGDTAAACGKNVTDDAWLTDDPSQTTCGGCKRTVRWKHADGG